MFYPKKTTNKEKSSYKSLYIKDYLIKEVEKISKKYNTSFYNVVVSMIGYCLEKEDI